MKTIVLGPPGTGKTTTLLNLVDKYLKQTDPNKIGYFAFTQKAAHEARDRALTKFNLSEDDLPYFRTLHSLAFRRLGIQKQNVMQKRHYADLGNKLGFPVDYEENDQEMNGIFSTKSDYLRILQLAKLRNISFEKQYDLKEHTQDVEFDKLKIIAHELERYKKEYGLVDFNDMILNFIKANASPQFDVVFVDEAQDLSLMQWDMVKTIWNRTADNYIAGDDDQAIFGWAGADVDSFINFDAVEIPLKQSKRVPRMIHTRALLRLDNIKSGRLEKPWNTPTSEDGTIKIFFSIDSINMQKGDWYILARTNDLLKPIIRGLKKRGLYFETKQGRSISESLYRDILHWEKWKNGKELTTIEVQRLLERFDKKFEETDDKLFKLDELKTKYKLDPRLQWYDAFTAVTPHMKTYIRAMRSNGEDLRLKPRIKVLTLHGSKGGEATNVIILQNQTRNTIKGATKTIMKQDEEQRVWYVGLTRCSKNLFLIRCKDRSKEFKI